jgi:uncharacterized YkwD family protein/spore coat assembly protein SafA
MKGGQRENSGPRDTEKQEKEKRNLKRIISVIISAAMALSVTALSAFAAGAVHTVVRGDTLWRIAVKYEVGLSEIKSANTHIKNYDLIYPGDKINIPQGDSTVSSYEREVIRLVNVERRKAGLTDLSEDWQLSRVARYKSEDMRNLGYFSHTSPTYGSPFEMMKSFGISYRSAGENIARGQKSPAAVVNAWMNSSGHRANILNKSFTHIGVGYVSDGSYWTQMFISK